MRSKKVVILPLMACLLFLAYSPMATAAVDTHRVLSFTEWDLRVRAYAQYQTYPGDEIEVRVTAEALDDLDDLYITIDVFGSKSEDGKEGYDSWEDEIRVLRGVNWEEGDEKDKKYDVEIPKDSDPGLVYGHVTAEWSTVADDEDHTYEESFIVTYVINKDYEEIQEDYEDLLSIYDRLKTNYDNLLNTYNDLLAEYNPLKSEYESLKSNYDGLRSTISSLESEHNTLVDEHNALVSDYDNLQNKYTTLESDHTSLESDYNSLVADYDALESRYEMSAGELGTSTNLMYVFVVTTIVFIATTAILALRKPKGF